LDHIFSKTKNSFIDLSDFVSGALGAQASFNKLDNVSLQLFDNSKQSHRVPIILRSVMLIF
jgi:hypothetical protein